MNIGVFRLLKALIFKPSSVCGLCVCLSQQDDKESVVMQALLFHIQILFILKSQPMFKKAVCITMLHLTAGLDTHIAHSHHCGWLFMRHSNLANFPIKWFSPFHCII